MLSPASRRGQTRKQSTALSPGPVRIEPGISCADTLTAECRGGNRMATSIVSRFVWNAMFITPLIFFLRLKLCLWLNWACVRYLAYDSSWWHDWFGGYPILGLCLKRVISNFMLIICSVKCSVRCAQFIQVSSNVVYDLDGSCELLHDQIMLCKVLHWFVWNTVLLTRLICVKYFVHHLVTIFMTQLIVWNIVVMTQIFCQL